MGLAEKYLPHYTHDDWIHWEGRWELIDGIPVAMSPMPLPEHQRLASELGTELTLAIRKSGCRDCRVYQPIDYKIKEDTIFEPDLLVVCSEITKRFLDFTPALIIEILSKSSEEKDRGVKYDYYQQEGVRYYLMVDVGKKTIEIYELISGVYQLQNSHGAPEFKLSSSCIIHPDFTSIWN